MNRQEILDKIARLVTRPAVDTSHEIPTCVYRHDNGARCAFGAIIPDDLYSPKMEGTSAFTLLREYPALQTRLGIDLATDDDSFIQGLQNAHDDAAKTYEQPASVSDF